jgi:hypothetical protein
MRQPVVSPKTINGKPTNGHAVITDDYVHPPCAGPGCDREILRREGDTLSRWIKRRCCSPECARAAAIEQNYRRIEHGGAAWGVVIERRLQAPETDNIGCPVTQPFAAHNVRTQAAGRVSRPPTGLPQSWPNYGGGCGDI